jgi:hypothetical protein
VSILYSAGRLFLGKTDRTAPHKLLHPVVRRIRFHRTPHTSHVLTLSQLALRHTPVPARSTCRIKRRHVP